MLRACDLTVFREMKSGRRSRLRSPVGRSLRTLSSRRSARRRPGAVADEHASRREMQPALVRASMLDGAPAAAHRSISRRRGALRPPRHRDRRGCRASACARAHTRSPIRDAARRPARRRGHLVGGSAISRAARAPPVDHTREIVAQCSYRSAILPKANRLRKASAASGSPRSAASPPAHRRHG